LRMVILTVIGSEVILLTIAVKNPNNPCLTNAQSFDEAMY